MLWCWGCHGLVHEFNIWWWPIPRLMLHHINWRLWRNCRVWWCLEKGWYILGGVTGSKGRVKGQVNSECISYCRRAPKCPIFSVGNVQWTVDKTTIYVNTWGKCHGRGQGLKVRGKVSALFTAGELPSVPSSAADKTVGYMSIHGMR